MQDGGFEVDEFLTMDRPPHGRIRTTYDKKFHLIDGGRRFDGRTDGPSGMDVRSSSFLFLL